MNSKDMAGLIERLEKASGPDREIDDAIRTMFGGFLPFTALETDDVVRIGGGLVQATMPPRVVNNQTYHLPRYCDAADGLGVQAGRSDEDQLRWLRDAIRAVARKYRRRQLRRRVVPHNVLHRPSRTPLLTESPRT